MDACAQCGGRGEDLLRCTGCRASFYCDPDCQRQHWPAHRDACKAKAAQAKAQATAAPPASPSAQSVAEPPSAPKPAAAEPPSAPKPKPKAKPAKHAAKPKVDFEAGLARAKELLQQNMFPEAEPVVRMLMDIDPTHAQPHFFLAICHAAYKRELDAIKEYQLALKYSNGTMIYARVNCIPLLATNGRADEALQYAKESVLIEPNVADRHYMLGCLLREKGSELEASQSFARAILHNHCFKEAYINNDAMLLKLGSLQACRKMAAKAVEQTKQGKMQFWTDVLQRPPAYVTLCRVGGSASARGNVYGDVLDVWSSGQGWLFHCGCPGGLLGLKAKAWHDPAEFPWTRALEAAYPQILKEVQAVMNLSAVSDSSKAMPASWGAVGARSAHDASLVKAGAWKEFPLLGGTGPILANCQKCPTASQILMQVPEILNMSQTGMGEALFSVISPGTHLRPHCGSTNARLTCHMGLIVPDGCKIRAGDEVRKWEPGKCIVFDDSFEHEVWHEGESPRVVLLINFWHPGYPRSKWAPIQPDTAYNAV